MDMISESGKSVGSDFEVMYKKEKWSRYNSLVCVVCANQVPSLQKKTRSSRHLVVESSISDPADGLLRVWKGYCPECDVWSNEKQAQIIQQLLKIEVDCRNPLCGIRHPIARTGEKSTGTRSNLSLDLRLSLGVSCSALAHARRMSVSSSHVGSELSVPIASYILQHVPKYKLPINIP